MNYFIKLIKRILIITVITATLCVLTVYALLWMPPVQQKIKNIALAEIMKITKNQLFIGEIEFKPFNAIVLKDVYASDLKGDTLLYAKQLSSRFSLTKLLKNQLLITSVELDNFTIRISKDSTNADFNFQFFIDAFASTDTTTKKDKSSLTIEIDNIRLNQGEITYNVLSENKLSGKFDANHIHIRDLFAGISLKSIDINHLDAAILSFALKEQSGFELKNLKGKLHSDEKKIFLEDFLLQLPQSELKIDSAFVDYTGTSLNRLVSSAQYSLALEIPQLSPSDLQAFYPPLKQLNKTLSFEGKFSGKFPEVTIERCNIAYGKNLSLDMRAQMNDYIQWKKSEFELIINHFVTDSKGIDEILAFSSPKTSVNFNSDHINLTGKVTGSLPGFNLHLAMNSLTGNIVADGSGSYKHNSHTLGFDTKLSISNFNLSTLMRGNPTFGMADMQLLAKGQINSGGKINASADVRVDRFDFNRYTYNNIRFSGAYLNDSISLDLKSNDKNLPLELTASLNMQKQNREGKLQARLNHIKPHAANLIRQFEGIDITAILKADIKGIEPEDMIAGISIDSLRVNTPTGTIEQSHFRLDFQALPEQEKNIRIQSGSLNGSLYGNFSFNHLPLAFSNTLSTYFPGFFHHKTTKNKEKASMNFSFSIRDTEHLSQTLSLPFTLTDTSVVSGKYEEQAALLNLQVKMPKVKIKNILAGDVLINMQTDSLKHKIKLLASTVKLSENTDSLLVKLNAELGTGILDFNLNLNNNSPNLKLSGDIGATVHIEESKDSKEPAVLAQLKHTIIEMNQKQFEIQPAQLKIQGRHYAVENFKLTLSENEYLKIDGVVSPDIHDTLRVNLSHLNVETLLEAFKYNNMGINGTANGEFIINQALASPRIFTDDFSIQDISLKGKSIGTLTVLSDWNEERQGIFFKSNLKQPDGRNSSITGYLLPAKDSISVDADIQAIQMNWLEPFTQNILYDLSGEFGARIKATGKMTKPNLSGYLSMNNVSAGLKMTNVKYTISDSIMVTPDNIFFKDLKIKDTGGNNAVINGNISHSGFLSFSPRIKMEMQNFMVLNNPLQTDSLFYGNLKLNGSIDITGTEKDILVKMALRNNGKSRIFFKIPESENEAQRYTNITFINPNDSIENKSGKFPAPTSKDSSVNKSTTPATSLPVKLQIALAVNPDMELGAVYNLETKDAASVTGSGNLDLSYDLGSGKMQLFGDYTVNDGQCNVSLKNIIPKTFKISPGGVVKFNGDPMATSFNVTAIYSQRADLTTLDKSFENDNLPSTKVLVNCLIKASGNLNKMDIGYDIDLPNTDSEIKRKVDGLIYSDDLKIKEIAYLMALGVFAPATSSPGQEKGGGGNLWTSLASAPLNKLLSSLLSGVLNENWTIGTELHANDNDMSNIEMDVNVSTRFFNDRLMLNSNFGYRNNPSTTTNFTGDFDLQLKMTKSGDLLLKVYNITNDQYYEQSQAPTTQGVGIVYKKEAKTFRNLFKKIKRTITK